MRVDDDQALAVLAKDAPQHDFGNRAGIDQIAEHAARPHRRQLIDVADENQMAMRIDRAQQMIHQGEIHHRRFIDDDEVRFQRIILGALKAAFARIEFEQTMNRHRFFAGAFGHALGGAPGRRRQDKADFGAAQDRQKRGQQRGLARSRAAGDDQYFFTQRLLGGARLIRVQASPPKARTIPG